MEELFVYSVSVLRLDYYISYFGFLDQSNPKLEELAVLVPLKYILVGFTI